MADSPSKRTTRVQQRAYDAFTLSEFTGQLDELNVEQLAGFLAVTICGQFAIPRVQVFLRKQARLVLAASKGLDRREPSELLLTHHMHEKMVRAKAARRFQDVADDEVLALLANEFTAYWRPALIFPMIHKSALVGLCAVGDHLDGQPPGDYQKNLLTAMVSHVSLAIGNSHMLEKVDETTRLLEGERRALDNTREDFVRLACHELNTPLTIINLTLNLLLDDETARLNNYQKELVSQIKQSCDRLAEIHDDLILLARRRGAAPREYCEKHPFKEILDHALARTRELFAQRTDLTLHVSVPDDLPPVLADKVLLSKAFVNVLHNAIKFTPETGGKIEVCAYSEDNVITCRITDSGIGIDPKHLDSVFEPFTELIDPQKRSSSKTKFLGAGMGLGLTIARDVMERHGGKIWLTSKGLNSGTTVFLQIPAATD